MDPTVLTTIAATGFGVAFLHAAMPTHWLPFVLTARVQHWGRGRTIAVTLLAGTGHVAVTSVIGVAITWGGMKLSESAGAWFTRGAAAILALVALYYAFRQWRGRGHVHFGYPHEHLHDHHDNGSVEMPPQHSSDRAAIWSLIAFLTISPCEVFLPIYASGIRYGWKGFAVLTIILSIGTVLGMVVFTSISQAGLNRIRLAWMEKYESGGIAFLLLVVAGLVLFLE